jgi:hypothetical protein
MLMTNPSPSTEHSQTWLRVFLALRRTRPSVTQSGVASDAVDNKRRAATTPVFFTRTRQALPTTAGTPVVQSDLKGTVPNLPARKTPAGGP